MGSRPGRARRRRLLPREFLSVAPGRRGSTPSRRRAHPGRLRLTRSGPAERTALGDGQLVPRFLGPGHLPEADLVMAALLEGVFHALTFGRPGLFGTIVETSNELCEQARRIF